MLCSTELAFLRLPVCTRSVMTQASKDAVTFATCASLAAWYLSRLVLKASAHFHAYGIMVECAAPGLRASTLQMNVPQIIFFFAFGVILVPVFHWR